METCMYPALCPSISARQKKTLTFNPKRLFTSTHRACLSSIFLRAFFAANRLRSHLASGAVNTGRDLAHSSHTFSMELNSPFDTRLASSSVKRNYMGPAINWVLELIRWRLHCLRSLDEQTKSAEQWVKSKQSSLHYRSHPSEHTSHSTGGRAPN